MDKPTQALSKCLYVCLSDGAGDYGIACRLRAFFVRFSRENVWTDIDETFFLDPRIHAWEY